MCGSAFFSIQQSFKSNASYEDLIFRNKVALCALVAFKHIGPAPFIIISSFSWTLEKKIEHDISLKQREEMAAMDQEEPFLPSEHSWNRYVQNILKTISSENVR